MWVVVDGNVEGFGNSEFRGLGLSCFAIWGFLWGFVVRDRGVSWFVGLGPQGLAVPALHGFGSGFCR